MFCTWVIDIFILISLWQLVLALRLGFFYLLVACLLLNLLLLLLPLLWSWNPLGLNTYHHGIVKLFTIGVDSEKASTPLQTTSRGFEASGLGDFFFCSSWGPKKLSQALSPVRIGGVESWSLTKWLIVYPKNKAQEQIANWESMAGLQEQKQKNPEREEA